MISGQPVKTGTLLNLFKATFEHWTSVPCILRFLFHDKLAEQNACWSLVFRCFRDIWNAQAHSKTPFGPYRSDGFYRLGVTWRDFVEAAFRLGKAFQRDQGMTNKVWQVGSAFQVTGFMHGRDQTFFTIWHDAWVFVRDCPQDATSRSGISLTWCTMYICWLSHPGAFVQIWGTFDVFHQDLSKPKQQLDCNYIIAIIAKYSASILVTRLLLPRETCRWASSTCTNVYWASSMSKAELFRGRVPHRPTTGSLNKFSDH